MVIYAVCIYFIAIFITDIAVPIEFGCNAHRAHCVGRVADEGLE